MYTCVREYVLRIPIGMLKAESTVRARLPVYVCAGVSDWETTCQTGDGRCCRHKPPGLHVAGHICMDGQGDLNQ